MKQATWFPASRGSSALNVRLTLPEGTQGACLFEIVEGVGM